MKPALLWIGASFFALYLLLRYRRGAKRKLAGKVSTRFVRQVSVLLVAAGCGSSSKQEAEPVFQTKAEAKEEVSEVREREEGEPDKFPEFADVTVSKPLKTPYPDFFPHALEAKGTNDWLAVQNKRGAWAEFKQELVSGNELAVRPGYLSSSLSEFVALYKNKNATLRDLSSTLLQIEAAGIFDTWFAGYFYQRVNSLPVNEETANLFSRIESHSRVAESFVIALAHSKVVRPRAWMSKAAPPAGYNRSPTLTDPEQFLREAFAHYTKEDGGSWETQSRIAATLVGGSAVLMRRGETIPLQGGFFFRRLDVVVATTMCELRIPFLGVIEIPAGTKLTSRSLHSLLTPATKQLLHSYVVRALAGDQEAVRRLSRLTPVAVNTMREMIENNSHVKGAATIRSLLFDTSW